jgi:hypothetical protein
VVFFCFFFGFWVWVWGVGGGLIGCCCFVSSYSFCAWLTGSLPPTHISTRMCALIHAPNPSPPPQKKTQTHPTTRPSSFLPRTMDQGTIMSPTVLDPMPRIPTIIPTSWLVRYPCSRSFSLSLSGMGGGGGRLALLGRSASEARPPP